MDMDPGAGSSLGGLGRQRSRTGCVCPEPQRGREALCKGVLLEIIKLLDLPGGSVVKILCCTAGGPFNPWSRELSSHMPHHGHKDKIRKKSYKKK